MNWKQEYIAPSGTNDMTELFDVATDLYKAGRCNQALFICRKIINLQPNHTNALHLLGILEQQSGNSRAAEHIFKQLVAHVPADHTVWSNYGVVCLSIGNHHYAQYCFEHALRISPDFADAWNNLGLLFDKTDTVRAKECFLKALKIDPAAVDAVNNLALHCKRTKQITDAIHYYRQSLAIRDTQPEIWYRLGEMLEDAARTDEAYDAYQRSLALNPDDAVRVRVATLLPVLTDSIEQIIALRNRLLNRLDLLEQEKLAIERPWEKGRVLFYLAYHGLNDRTFHERLAALYRQASPLLTWQAPHINRKRTVGEKIRIGFISRFFYRHTIAKLNIGLVEQLDRSRFHVSVLLIDSGSHDEMTERYERTADCFILLQGGLVKMREQIAANELDILVYTDIGMEPFSYFLAFARLAPVQCVTWGHPATTGISTVDYFISHELCETEASRSAYSEKLFCISSAAACACYAVPDLPHTGRTWEYYGIAADKTVYYCPQPPFKMHPDFDALLHGILNNDPNGIIVLLRGVVPETERLLLNRLRQKMPEHVDRITVIDPLPFDDYITMFRLADVVLDTPHFSGGSSSVEALAVGAPVVTLPSPYLKGRLTYAWYKRLGIDDGIACSNEEYIATAVKLGTNPELRRDLTNRILDASHRLFDDLQFVRELEFFFSGISCNSPDRHNI
jgi:predicted O-linked N-acetylglucosamine transferase (SPINDLY family)